MQKKIINKKMDILDLGCGSGIIAIIVNKIQGNKKKDICFRRKRRGN